MSNEQLIDSIVAEVLSQLRARSTAAPTLVAPTTAAPVTATAKASATAIASVAPTALSITDRVVTAELLASRIASGAAPRVAICPKAVVTPSARDWLKSRRIDWHRNTAEVTPHPTKPVTKWRAVLVKPTAAVTQAVEHIAKTSFGRTWSQQTAGSAEEAATTAAGLIARGEATGVAVFAQQAERVVCQACRDERVHAAVISEVAVLSELKASMGLNVMVVKPDGKGFFELNGLLTAFAASR